MPVHFIFSGIIEVTRQVKDRRVLNVRRLGPGDSYGEISLLSGTNSRGTFTALTSGLLLGLQAADLKPILEARPELVESLSHSAAKLQQFVTTFDRAAIQPVAIEEARSFMPHPEFLSSGSPIMKANYCLRFLPAVSLCKDRSVLFPSGFRASLGPTKSLWLTE